MRLPLITPPASSSMPAAILTPRSQFAMRLRRSRCPWSKATSATFLRAAASAITPPAPRSPTPACAAAGPAVARSPSAACPGGSGRGASANLRGGERKRKDNLAIDPDLGRELPRLLEETGLSEIEFEREGQRA